MVSKETHIRSPDGDSQLERNGYRYLLHSCRTFQQSAEYESVGKSEQKAEMARAPSISNQFWLSCLAPRYPTTKAAQASINFRRLSKRSLLA